MCSVHEAGDDPLQVGCVSQQAGPAFEMTGVPTPHRAALAQGSGDAAVAGEGGLCIERFRARSAARLQRRLADPHLRAQKACEAVPRAVAPEVVEGSPRLATDCNILSSGGAISSRSSRATMSPRRARSAPRSRPIAGLPVGDRTPAAASRAGVRPSGAAPSGLPGTPTSFTYNPPMRPCSRPYTDAVGAPGRRDSRPGRPAAAPVNRLQVTQAAAASNSGRQATTGASGRPLSASRAQACASVQRRATPSAATTPRGTRLRLVGCGGGPSAVCGERASSSGPSKQRGFSRDATPARGRGFGGVAAAVPAILGTAAACLASDAGFSGGASGAGSGDQIAQHGVSPRSPGRSCLAAERAQKVPCDDGSGPHLADRRCFQDLPVASSEAFAEVNLDNMFFACMTPTTPSRGSTSGAARSPAPKAGDKPEGTPKCDASAAGGVEHFCIGDMSMEQPPSPTRLWHSGSALNAASAASRTQQFQEVATSLETAASAIRKVIHRTSMVANISPEVTLRPPGENASPAASSNSSASSPITSASQRCVSSCTSFSATFVPPAGCSGKDQSVSSARYADSSRCASVGDVAARLSRENEALRGALTDAVSRLAELEGEKEQFLSEGVFDLVNTVCRDKGEDFPDAAADHVTTVSCEKETLLLEGAFDPLSPLSHNTHHVLGVGGG